MIIGKKEEGRRKKEEGRRKKEEGRRKKEEGRKKNSSACIPNFLVVNLGNW
ncbi:MAG: hypothetical protein WCF82_20765 [Microcoleus sp.]